MVLPRKRVTFTVSVDLDPIPGWGHEPEDWHRFLENLLEKQVSHYNPTVTLTGQT